MTDWFPGPDADLPGLSVRNVYDLAERRFQSLFGVTRSKSSPQQPVNIPDLVVEDIGTVPLGIELKLASEPLRLFVHPSRMIAEAVRTRRLFPWGVHLVLVIIVRRAFGADSEEDWQPPREVLQRLVRGQEGEGFDRVYVSLDGKPSRWWEYDGSGMARSFSGIEAAVQRIRDVATNGGAWPPVTRATTRPLSPRRWATTQLSRTARF